MPDPLVSSRVSSTATVSPAPSDEEAAAISAAVELLWPQPVVAQAELPRALAWRFSGRWWRRDRYSSADRPWR